MAFRQIIDASFSIKTNPGNGYYSGLIASSVILIGLVCVALLGKYILWREEQVEKNQLEANISTKSTIDVEDIGNTEEVTSVKTSKVDLLRRELYSAPTKSWINLTL